jgi:hypothetical protein
MLMRPTAYSRLRAVTVKWPERSSSRSPRANQAGEREIQVGAGGAFGAEFAHELFEMFEAMLAQYPFPILGLHFDN